MIPAISTLAFPFLPPQRRLQSNSSVLPPAPPPRSHPAGPAVSSAVTLTVTLPVLRESWLTCGARQPHRLPCLHGFA